MTDIAALGLSVDTRQVTKAEGDLDKLTAAGGRTEASAKRVGDAWSKTAQAIQADTGRIVQQLQAMNAAQARQESLLSQLNGTMQAVERAVQGLTAAQIESTRAVQGQAAATASETAAAKAAADALARQQQATAAATKAASDAAAAQAKQAAEADKLARETLKVEQANRKSAEAAARQRDEMDKQRQSGSGLQTVMAGVGAAMAAAFVVKRVVDVTMALYEASAAGERLRTTLNFASGGNGAQELAYVTKMANQLGLQLGSTAKAYASFAAAAKGTTLEGKATRDVFEAVSKASAVMGLSAEQSSGALLALQQMVSKGTVQAEELRGQLGERLPGAFQIAARAMGTTTAGLGKMLEQGQVVTDDFLPKFAKALNEHIGTAAESAADRLDASVNRMNNAWERTKRNIGDSGVSQAMQGQFNILADGLDAVSESMEGARASGDGLAGQMLAGAGATLKWLNPLNGFSYETQSLAAKSDEAAKELQKLQERAAALTNGLASGLYGSGMQKELDDTNVKLEEARRRFNALDAQIKRLNGQTTGPATQAGVRTIDNAIEAAAARQREADDGAVKAYIDNTDRMDKAGKQRAAIDKAVTAATEARKRANTDAQRADIARAEATEIANIKEQFRDKGAAAGAKAQQNAYESLLASINTKIAAEKEELAVGRQLTDSEKFAIKLNEEIAAGKTNITAAARAEIEARIAELATMEEAARAKEREKVLDEQRAEGQRELAAAYVEQSKAREAGDLAIAEYLRTGQEAQEMVETEIANLGRTASERAVANEQLRIELERRQQIEAIGKNTGYTPEQRTAAEGKVNAGAVDATVMAQTKADLEIINNLMDPTKAEDFGAALRGAFEGALSPLSKMIDSMSEYTKQLAEQEKERAAIERTLDGEKKMSALRKLESKELKNQIGFWGDIADSSKAFFKEGSKGYKTMDAVSKAFRMAEMALAAESMIKQIFGIGEVVTTTVLGEQTKNAASVGGTAIQVGQDMIKGQSAAAVAVATQGQGDSYSAFARIAAMAALMATLGFAVGGGGGAGASEGYEGIKAGGTGGVLGAEGDPSKSIGNAIEMLADNSRIELTVSQRMLSELTKVREGIQGLAGDISKDFFIRGMAGGSFGDAFLDSGVGFLPGQDVGSIINDGINGFGFNLIFANGAQAMWRELDPAFKTSISSVLGNIVDTVISAADMLGLNDGGLIDRMLSIIPTLGDTSTYALNGMGGMVGGGLLSFKDKSGKEIQEELEAVFSSVGDQMVAQALPALAAYQRVGEGMFETLVRVTSGIERAEYALERYGIAAVNYADVIRKDGDLATEIIRQSVMALEPVGSGVAQILRDFTGEFEDLLDTYDQLVNIRGLLRDIGADDMALGVGQVRGAGGIDSLQSGIESFRDAFFTEQEQVDAAWSRMAEQFVIINQAMPTTNDGFRTLALGIDQSTQEGAELFGRLMTLAEGFADVTDRTDTLAEAARQAAEEQAEIARQAAEEQAEIARQAADAAIKAAEEQARLAQQAADAAAASWTKLWRAVDANVADFLSGEDLRGYRADSLAEQFRNIGIDVSSGTLLRATKDDFQALWESLDLTTTAGREQAAAMMGLWGAFKQLTPEVVAVTDTLRADTLRAATDAVGALRRATAERKAALQGQHDADVDALKAQHDAATDARKAQYDAEVKALKDAEKLRSEANKAAQRSASEAIRNISNVLTVLESGIASVRVESQGLTMLRRQAGLQYVTGAAASGRSATSFAGLEAAVEALSEPSEALYSTFEEYAIDQAAAAAALYTMRDRTAAQLSAQESLLAALEAADEAAAAAHDATMERMQSEHDATMERMQSEHDATMERMQSEHDATIKALDDQLEYAEQHLDVLNGIDNSVVSVEAAMERTRVAVVRAADAQLAQGAEQSKALWALYYKTFPDAVDGSHAMGLASVPWDGYRAELHAGERVLTKEDNEIFSRGDWLRGGSGDNRRVEMLLEQILDNDRGTRKDMNNGNREVISNTRVAASVALRNEVNNQPAVIS